MQNAGEAGDSLPETGSVVEELEDLVQYAVLAPSGHNTQPWKFSVSHDELRLFADRSRALSVVDPQDRELTISCGAALDHLLLAARCAGLATRVKVLPGGDPDLLAIVRANGTTRPTAEDLELFEAIPMRRTSRSGYESKMIPDELLENCREAASTQGVELVLHKEQATKQCIADLVAEGDRRQFADPEFRAELARWIRSRRSRRRDGISADAFGMPDVLSPVSSLVVRSLNIGGSAAKGDRKKATDASPLLAVLATPGDAADDWLRAGRALSRILLRLTSAGATAAYLNQPVEVEDLRSQLRQAAAVAGHPQLLMRFGYGSRPPAAARRPVDEVMI